MKRFGHQFITAVHPVRTYIYKNCHVSTILMLRNLKVPIEWEMEFTCYLRKEKNSFKDIPQFFLEQHTNCGL